MNPKGNLERTAFAVTRWIGSPGSIVVHSVLFVASFAAPLLGLIVWDRMLLILTTIVSLEAIYLSLFIQMTVNFQAEDIDEIQEDIDEMQEDVGEIQKDVDEIQEDVDELQEDVEDITEEDAKEGVREEADARALETIQADLRRLVDDISRLQKDRPGSVNAS